MWKELQISPDVHNAVFAWVHYRQVRCVAAESAPACSGSGGLLAAVLCLVHLV